MPPKYALGVVLGGSLGSGGNCQLAGQERGRYHLGDVQPEVGEERALVGIAKMFGGRRCRGGRPR
eukprot:5427672-Alexandrium_andersonii.AAC.1